MMDGKGSLNGHEYVDLGLPSGLLWATCNIGANYPYEFGNYYAWGETSIKKTYSMGNYKFNDGSKITKYTKSDRLTVLIASDDAATVNFGGDWRMPTKEEFEELKYKCKWEKCRIEVPNREIGIRGNKVTGPNGNSIFLPYAGVLDEYSDKHVSSQFGRQCEGGHYWTRSRGDLQYCAWRMMLDANHIEKNVVNQCFIQFGNTIRPVASRNVRRSAKSSGCYVATAVYGSYNCPEVWTLRRFRDNTLDETWYGRAFIKTYYAISPTLVKWFGKTPWFKRLWRRPLDKLVASLRSKGVEDSPYQDKY